MTCFNVPNLYFVEFDHGTHIARTMIEGGKTECGLTLTKGQNWTRHADEYCQRCAENIERLSYPGRGLDLDAKHQEWLHLRSFAP